MPHFIVDCSEQVLNNYPAELILQEIHETAYLTGLFENSDIKVRIRSFKDFTVGSKKINYIHVFGNIMEGRKPDQKMNLSKKIIKKLKTILPDVPVISMNVREFERETYCNREMV